MIKSRLRPLNIALAITVLAVSSLVSIGPKDCLSCSGARQRLELPSYSVVFQAQLDPHTMSKPIMICFNGTSIYSSRIRIAVIVLITTMVVLSFLAGSISAQQRRPVKHASICGDPTAACKTSATFQPYDLPFRLPANAVIYDTDLFYAVVLKSVSVPADNCDIFVPESERLAAQALFTNHKVFSSRCAEPGGLSYTNTSSKAQFMAVYAGMTLAEANRMLALVKATGKFPGANIRRMRALFNGT